MKRPVFLFLALIIFFLPKFSEAQVIVFAKEHFYGIDVPLKSGLYEFNDILNVKGLDRINFSNGIKSIKIEEGYTVMLYPTLSPKRSRNGQPFDTDQNSFSRKYYSILIRKKQSTPQAPPGERVSHTLEIYSSPEFKGVFAGITGVGTYNFPDLVKKANASEIKAGIEFSDGIKSIKVPKNYMVTLYESSKPAPSSRQMVLTESSNRLNGKWVSLKFSRKPGPGARPPRPGSKPKAELNNVKQDATQSGGRMRTTPSRKLNTTVSKPPKKLGGNATPKPDKKTKPIVVFSQANFQGKSLDLGVGKYTREDLMKAGIKRINSIKIKPGYIPYLIKETGQEERVWKDRGKLYAKFTGIRITNAPKRGNPKKNNKVKKNRRENLAVKVHFRSKFGRNSVDLPVGKYTSKALYAKLKTSGFSKITVPQGLKAEVFRSPNLTGTSRTVKGGETINFNGRSIKITPE